MPERERWWAQRAGDVADRLETDVERGLDTGEAARRLAEHGPNELQEEPVEPPILIFARQFASTLIVMLLIAVAITVAIGEITDAIVISVILVLNAIIGFVQEYRAENAMAALREMTALSSRVVRDAAESTVPATDLVPGDVIVLEAGDVVPADARLVETADLRVDEAALTGESLPVSKTTDAVERDSATIDERTDMVFKGTAVVHGRARAVLVATGMDTELGRIAGLLRSHRAPRTPLQRRLAVLGRWLAVAAALVCLVVFLAGIARGEDTTEMLLTAVSLAVAAVPESLPAVVTIALALGAQRMAAHRALVRRLPAVETLGSVTVICSDKTGTLTQNAMAVEHVWTASGPVEVAGAGYEPHGELYEDGEPIAAEPESPLHDLVVAAALCNDAQLAPPGDSDSWTVVGDPTEGALLTLAARAGVERDVLSRTHPREAEAPFDSSRRRMTTAHADPNGGLLVAAKGAVESILEISSRIATEDGTADLDSDRAETIASEAERLASEGYRVLAVAGGHIEGSPPSDGVQLEDDLTFYGLVAMADPPRDEAELSVQGSRSAGITPVMITGDHPSTARSIAQRLGMLDEKRVVTGDELAEIPTETFRSDVDSISVYARTDPEQKLDIVEAWQSRDEIVAMTGDGVNDAPALRTAEIGVAMGIQGTEVAKEAADMVLADDNFATIVSAIKEGRRIYDNIRRFVRYTLTSNTGEIWVMLAGPFVGLSLPLVPVQILWINLVTDGLPGLALGVESAEPDVMERPPRRPSESFFARGLWQHVLLVGLVMGAVPLAIGAWGESAERPWQTMLFTTLVVAQLGHALAVRSETQSLRALGLTSNRPLLGAVLLTLALQFAVVYWPPAQEIFDTEALSAGEMALALVASTVVFWLVEIEKAVRRRRGLTT